MVVVRGRIELRHFGYLSGLGEGLRSRQSSGRPSTVVVFGHVPMLVEDLRRIVIPLFFTTKFSIPLCCNLLTRVFSSIANHAVVLHNTAHNYNSTEQR